MKVLIITEGSTDLGLGHVIRCISLQQAFESEGAQTMFFLNGNNAAESLIRAIPHNSFNWIKEQNKLLKRIKEFDIVILDSLIVKNDLANKLSNESKIFVFLNDIKRFDLPKGIIINRTVGAEKLKYPKKKGYIYLLGSKYLPLTKAFWYSPQKKISKNIESIMITFGGTDHRDFTPTLLKFFSDKYKSMNKIIIIGTGFENTEELRHLKDSNTQLYYYPSGETMKNIMLDADIAISAGGQTLFELARIGVPTISILTAENQKGNIESLTNANFLKHAGSWDDKNILHKTEQLIDFFKPKDIRKKYSTAGLSLIDGYGSVRIANFVLGAANIIKQ